jgi:uncharacterized membrane protein
MDILLPWLKLLHILSAIVWLGGGLMLLLVATYVRSRREPEAVRLFSRLLPFAALRSLTPAVVVLLVTGVWLVLAGVGWSFSQLWVQLALGLFALAFLIGAAYMSRVAGQLERVAKAEVLDQRDASAVLARWQLGYGLILLALVVAAWDMVFKPGL